MALAFFDVPHTSVRVVLRDETRTKTLDLSPAVLARRSGFFAARYRPGTGWAEESVLGVRDAVAAEAVLRICHDDEDALRACRWSLIRPALEFMDMLQCDDAMIAQTFKHALRLIEAEGARVFFGVGAGSFAVPLEDMRALRETRVGRDPGFLRLLGEIFESLSKDEEVPKELRIDHWWFYIFGVVAERGADALVSVAKDLRDCDDEETARIHLQHIVRRGSLYAPKRIQVAVLDILGEIGGDETGDSLVMRARNLLALRLLGGIPTKTASLERKRKIDHPSEEKG